MRSGDRSDDRRREQRAGSGLRQQRQAAAIEPGPVRQRDQKRDRARGPRIDRRQRCAPSCGRDREQREQRNQQRGPIGREQHQSEREPERQPVDPAAFVDRAPIEQQGERGERHPQNVRPELGRRHREREHTRHQKDRDGRVLRPHDRATQPVDRPERGDHARLRQGVDADDVTPSRGERDLGEPECQRRAEPGPELPLVPDRQHFRQVAGRARVEQRRHQQPQHRLRRGRGPEHGRRPLAQQPRNRNDTGHRRPGMERRMHATLEPNGKMADTNAQDRRRIARAPLSNTKNVARLSHVHSNGAIATASCVTTTSPSAAATGANERRWCGVGPSRASALKCSGTL